MRAAPRTQRAALSARAALSRVRMDAIVLDEISTPGLDEQAMLLRAQEEKSFLPLGAD